MTAALPPAAVTDPRGSWVRETFRFRRAWIPSLVGITVLLVVWQILGPDRVLRQWDRPDAHLDPVRHGH